MNKIKQLLKSTTFRVVLFITFPLWIFPIFIIGMFYGLGYIIWEAINDTIDRTVDML